MAQVSGCFTGDQAALEQTKLAQTRLFVGELSASTTEEQLYNYFRKFGALQEVLIPESMKGKSKLFAYVQFQEPEAAQTALAASKTLPFVNGKLLRTEIAILPAISRPESRKPGRSKVVLTGIPKGTKMQEIIERVSEFGVLLKINKYRLFKSKLSGCRVCFDSVASADDLVAQRYLVLESGAFVEVRPNSFRSSRKMTGDFSNENSPRENYVGELPTDIGNKPHLAEVLRIRSGLQINNLPRPTDSEQQSFQQDRIDDSGPKEISKFGISGQIHSKNYHQPNPNCRSNNLRFNLHVSAQGD